jgi:HEAT repeat protein
MIVAEPDNLRRAQLVASLDSTLTSYLVPMLVRVMQSDSYYGVRMNCALLLGEYGDMRAMYPLAERLRQDTDGQVREIAAASLGRLGATDALPCLRDALLADDDPDVREQAAQAVGASDSSEAVELLRIALLREPDWGVRIVIQSALREAEWRTLE